MPFWWRLLAVLALLLLARAPAGVIRAEEEPAPAGNESEATEPTGVGRQAVLEETERLSRQVGKLYGEQRYEEAAEISRRVLVLRERVFGPNSPEYGSALHNVGMILWAQGSHDEAHKSMKRALAIKEAHLGTAHRSVGDSLHNLGWLFAGQDRRAIARRYYKHALAVREAALGPQHVDVATTLSSLGVLEFDAGEFAAARAPFERVVQIFEANGQGAGRPLAQGLANLGRTLQRLGRSVAALRCTDREIAIWQEIAGPRNAQIAACLTRRGLIHRSLGDAAKALQDHQRALEMHKDLSGPDAPETALCMNDVAVLLIDAGAYVEARSLLDRALAIVERPGRASDAGVATTLNNFGMLLKAQGAYDEAERICRHLVRWYEERLGVEHPDLAVAINNLAGVYWAQDDPERARPLFERALALWEAAYGPDHELVATALGNLAATMLDLGEPGRAGFLVDRAMASHTRVVGAGHPSLAWLLAIQASVLTAKDHPKRAESALRRAADLLANAHGPGRAGPGAAAALVSWGTGLSELGRHEQAAVVVKRALRLTEERVRASMASLDGPHRRLLLQDQRWQLDRWLNLAEHVGETGYEEVFRVRGMLARAMAAERRLSRHARGAIKAQVEALAVAERRLAALARAVPSFNEREPLSAWRTDYTQAAAHRESLLLALQTQVAPLRADLERLEMRPERVQRQLGSDTALLSFLTSGERMLAWIVRRGGTPRRVDLGPIEAIEEAVEAFVEGATDREHDATGDAGAHLHQLVLGPLLAHLEEGVRALVICPDGALATVPFACLPGRRKGRLLIEDYLLSMVAMPHDLVASADAPVHTRGALVLGGVQFDARLGEADSSPPAQALADQLVALRGVRAPREGSFDPLPGTLSEANAVVGILGEDVVLLQGERATEDRVRTASTGKSIVHLATHGFTSHRYLRGLRRRKAKRPWLGAARERQLARGHDPLVLSGLALAGANARTGGGGQDGILTALEASRLHLDGVRLVVLSAWSDCPGRGHVGASVWLGLVQAFQAAGAHDVIGSLWKVDDEASPRPHGRVLQSVDVAAACA